MKSSLRLQNLVGVILLPVLFSCSKQALTVSGADEHYNADTYYVAGGFDAELDRQGREASINGSGDHTTNRARGNREDGADRTRSDFGSRNNDLGRADRLAGSQRWEDDERGAVSLDDDLGMSIADYRRAYRRGYRDGQWDANTLPGLYSPNYGGWGWGIGPGIGWNAPCWSWGGGWNYYAYWNNPWNTWYNPWGNGWGWGGGYGWGGGGYGWGYGGWNHWGGWNRWGWGGWNGWGGNTYVWIHHQPRYRSGPRRDRLNQINARNGSGNRMTPWGQASVNGASRRHGDFVSRVSTINRRNVTSANAVANAGSNDQRGRRVFSLPYAQERPAQREGVDQRTRNGVDYAGNPSVTSRERNYSYRDRFSESGTSRGSYYDKGTERTYGNDRVRGGTWSDRNRSSEDRSPRSEYSSPRSSYSTPRSSSSTPRSTYSAPRSTYSAPRSTYSAPRSSSGSSTGPSSGSSRSSSGSSSGTSGSGRSGSFSPRR